MPKVATIQKKAAHRVAFFNARFLYTTLLYGVLALFSHATPAGSASESEACLADKFDAEVRVSNVIDGDTVRLKGGRLVRFIGINTPEIDHEGPHTEAFALQARAALSRQIGPGKRIKLVYGSDGQDRYDRILAHVFSQDGSNIQAKILSIGLARWIVVPPNLRFRDCYRAAELTARQQKRNLWSPKGPAPLVIAANTQYQEGFGLIEGRVQRSSRDKNGLSLYLSNRMVLRVASRYLHYFSDSLFKSYKNNVIQVRGWLYPRKGGWQMSLKHPDSVQLKPGQ